MVRPHHRVDLLAVIDHGCHGLTFANPATTTDKDVGRTTAEIHCSKLLRIKSKQGVVSNRRRRYHSFNLGHIARTCIDRRCSSNLITPRLDGTLRGTRHGMEVGHARVRILGVRRSKCTFHSGCNTDGHTVAARQAMLPAMLSTVLSHLI